MEDEIQSELEIAEAEAEKDKMLDVGLMRLSSMARQSSAELMRASRRRSSLGRSEIGV